MTYMQHPDGLAVHITEGITRGRFRHSLTDPQLNIVPGATEDWEVELWETSICFRVGHRIRLEVSSSNFPRFDRNLNTGEDSAHGVRMVVAHQRVCQRVSRLVLPVVPTQLRRTSTLGRL